MEVKRIFDIPHYQLSRFPQEDALVAKIKGHWVKTSSQSFVEQGNLVSKALLKMGIGPGDKIAMVANNRPEWNIADLGISQIGAVNVPVYPTISAEDYAYIFNNAEVKLCLVGDQELLEKVDQIRSQVPSLTEVFSFDKLENTRHWSELLDMGSDGDMAQVEALKSQVKEDDLATLIYTSGTTGNPKGVMLSHKNIVSNVMGCLDRLPVDENSKAVSFLPLCHIYERMVLYLFMYRGVAIYYAESMETIGENIKEVQPHVFTAVPRLLEKVYDKIIAKGTALTGVKKKLFFWAVELGLQWEPYGQNGWWYEFRLGIADKLIFSKWREALGGNVQAIASGSAALQPRLARVFNAAGVPVMEGYGLTETSPVISVNCMGNHGLRIGTVGRPLNNVQVKIADDGEILVKGPNIMQGYYNNPEATADTIDENGWLHTGDIGELDRDNFLKITDRKKEMFKTSGGKYVAPQLLENKLKESRFIEQVMVIGENQKHPAALVVPDVAFVSEWCKRKEIGNCSTLQEMAGNDKIKERIWKDVQETNQGFAKYEQVKKIELCPGQWTIEGGEITPTLKLKRKQILQNYDYLVKRIYEE